MKRFSFIILLLCSINFTYSVNYSKVDKLSGSVPSGMKTPDQIAGYLTKGLTSPFEKTRAIYYWISHNIKYDVAAMNSNDTYINSKELVDAVLKRKMGVCAHYAELFHALCKSAGVESFVISGYTITNGQVARLPHAWNAVRIKSRFYAIDATWAAGHFMNGKYRQVFNDEYFLINPSVFIKTHIPFDPIWQFLDNPVSHVDVEKRNFSKLKVRSNFHYADSIKVMSKLNKADKYLRENLRIRKSGLANPLIRKYVAYNEEYIVSEKFNQAVGLFNKGVEDFNLYVMSKNNQFKDVSVNKERIRNMLLVSQREIESADKILNSLNSSNASLNRQGRDMGTSINEIKKTIREENLFLEKYFKSLRHFR